MKKSMNTEKILFSIEKLKEEKETIKDEYNEFTRAGLIAVLFYGTMAISVGLVDNLFVKCISLSLFSIAMLFTYFIWFRSAMNSKRIEIDNINKKIQDAYDVLINN